MSSTVYSKAQVDALLAAITAAGYTDAQAQAAVAGLLAAKAPLASPAFTGVPTVPTAATGTQTTQAASTGFVKAAIDALIAGAPGALDTLKEIADQLGADETAAAALTSLLDARSITGTNVVTAAATLVGSKRNAIDGSTGSYTVTLPAPTKIGQLLQVERTDTSITTTITIAAAAGATLRGNATATVALPGVGVAFEGLLFIAESLTSWTVAAGHKPKAWLDAIYVLNAKYKGLLDSTWESATTRSPSYTQGTTGTTIGGNGANAQSAVSFPSVNTLAVQVAPTACTKLRVAYGAFYYATDLPNALPIQGAAIEYPHNSGNIYPLTFGGSASVTIQPGAVVLSDEVTIPGGVAANVQYNIRTSLYFPAPQSGQAWPSYDVIKGLDKNLAAGSGSVNGVMTAYASFPSGNSAGYGPCGIFGNSGVSAKSVAAIGDSIVQGVNETNSANGVGNGYMHRAFAGSTVGIANLARHAERAIDWNTTVTKHRQRLAYSCSHAEVNYGINDIRVDSVTLSVLQVRSIAVWRDLATAGLKVRQHTITPNSTSTDSWATTANQSVANATQNAVRVGFNMWLRAGAPLDPYTFLPTPVGMAGAVTAGQLGHPLVGYREIANAVESAQDSGIWMAGYTQDGLHPSQTGHIAMAAVVTPASIT